LSVESREEYAQVCLPLYNPTPLDPDLLARTLLRHEVGLHFRRHEIKRIDLFSEAARIRCPTLILGGELDPITTVADVEELAAAIPNSQLEVFRDARHGVFRDQPTRALAVIREFVLARGDASATLEAGAV
jgi:pimeloyl-ACP methyl ester carboxylesterase